MSEKPKSGGWLTGALIVMLVWGSLDLARAVGRREGRREEFHEVMWTIKAYNAGLAATVETLHQSRP